MNSEINVAVIGGSGVYQLDGLKMINKHEVPTPFGMPSAEVIEAEIESHRFYFLPRHGEGHIFTPSEVNYRANIYALKKLGVRYVVSVSAVGSLKEEYAPGVFVLPDQFIDWTKGVRNRSFFGEGFVGHVSVANPVEKGLQKAIATSCNEIKVKHFVDGSYVCIEGPQFSTKAESTIYRSFGADVIGMTNVPEAYLAKEAGMAYATIAMVTDYDCWKEVHCTLEEIMKVMKQNYLSAQKVLKNLIPSLYKNPVSYARENENAVVTNTQKMNDQHREIMEVLLST